MKIIKVNIDPTQPDCVRISMSEGSICSTYSIHKRKDIIIACRKLKNFYNNAVAQYGNIRMELTNTKHLELGAIPVTVDAVINSIECLSNEFLDEELNIKIFKVDIDPRPKNSVVVSVENTSTNCWHKITISEKVHIQNACAKLQHLYDNAVVEARGVVKVTITNSLFPEWDPEFTTIENIKESITNWYNKTCSFE